MSGSSGHKLYYLLYQVFIMLGQVRNTFFITTLCHSLLWIRWPSLGVCCKNCQLYYQKRILCFPSLQEDSSLRKLGSHRLVMVQLFMPQKSNPCSWIGIKNEVILTFKKKKEMYKRCYCFYQISRYIISGSFHEKQSLLQPKNIYLSYSIANVSFFVFKRVPLQVRLPDTP